MAVDIVRRLRAASYTAYFAGGCVRDELLGLHPTDYDVATDAPPQRITEIFPRTAEVGASFGVVLVKSQGVSVEVATFRSDGPYSDRRRPDTVRFSDPQSDALRRDFTINALFLDPLETTDADADAGAGAGAAAGAAAGLGRVIDFVNGQADLRDRVLRAVGDPDQRLAEDHLRALRAVRFAARLSLTIDPATASALQRHARGLEGVSRERIGEELRRMLLDSRRAHALTLLQSLRLDAPVLQESNWTGQPTLVAALGDARAAQGASFSTVLAAWALDRELSTDLPAPFPSLNAARAKKNRLPSAIDLLVSRWRSALCLSNDESDQFGRTLRALASVEHSWGALGIAQKKRLASTQVFPESMRILRARNLRLAAEVDSEVAALGATAGGLAPTPLVDGDLLVAQGFEPGPAFKAILERVYDAQLEGRVTNVAQALTVAFQAAQELRT